MNRKNLLIMTILLLLGCDQHESGLNETINRENSLPIEQCSPIDNPFLTDNTHTTNNVILMIGDGMGLAHINAARLRAKSRNKPLTIDQLPITGLVQTHSSSQLVTDSAAAATAIATGFKTKNQVVGQAPDGTKLKTLLEAAVQKGLATGLIATSSITHATPAAFAAHVKNRKMQSKIAEQLIESNIDLLLGGGKAFFLPASASNSKRDDEKHLIDLAKESGYHFVETKQMLSNTQHSKILGLFAQDGLQFSSSEPSLAEMTQFAINSLSSNKRGFLLVIEGSQIDWAAHHNKTNETIEQTLLFDDAVEVALHFAKEQGDTLLLVTADHETGGLSLLGGDLDGSALELDWTTLHHTAIDVPIYSYGPNSHNFTGVMDNTCISKKIAQPLNLSFD